jgi:hypothetical protein
MPVVVPFCGANAIRSTAYAIAMKDGRPFGIGGLWENDLPLNFHPAAVRVSANVTPFGAVSVPAYAAGVL